MLALVSFYAILSALAAVLDLTHNAFIPAFCVAFMSCAAYIGGRELQMCLLRGSVIQKIGRLIYAGILLFIGYYLSQHHASSVNLYLKVIPGLWWFVVGAALGFIASSVALSPRGR